MSIEAIKASPPLGVGGMALWGMPLEQWLVILTIVYTIFLIIDKLPAVLKRIQQLVAYLKEKHE